MSWERKKVSEKWSRLYSQWTLDSERLLCGRTCECRALLHFSWKESRFCPLINYKDICFLQSVLMHNLADSQQTVWNVPEIIMSFSSSVHRIFSREVFYNLMHHAVPQGTKQKSAILLSYLVNFSGLYLHGFKSAKYLCTMHNKMFKSCYFKPLASKIK